ncbi:Myosin-52 [Frankliniella fusca]|uniref:Myosin-52 n=1 Tax=Frankliniella fusca TaxID=407009 RepID=A0AAE1HN26_9NEOP|nr:Myosin-52 [Frankliniella fusca]
MFFKSKHVRALRDCSQGRCYFLKASVRASMDKEAYEVTVTLSHRSGSIHFTCECIQQSLGRCVHVSSVLLALWSHIRVRGEGTCIPLMRRNGGVVLQWQSSSHFTTVLSTLFMN